MASNYLYRLKTINNKQYCMGYDVINQPVNGITIFAEPLPDPREDEYNNPLYRIEDGKRVLDPIDPGPAVKEVKRVEKVKAQLSQELPDLIYANKDDPAVLAAAMCDRVKVIDAETTVEPTPVKELER